MQRLIRYLYEYQNGRKVRNVGFVKAEDSGDFLSFWIYGNEFPVSVEGRLEIFLFYQKEDKCVGIPLGELPKRSPLTAYQVNYEGSTAKVEGVVLREDRDDANRWYAAGWKEPLPDVEQMIEEQALEVQDIEEQIEEQIEPKLTEQQVETEKIESQKVEQPIEKPQIEEPVVYKISRKDLVQLPRQEWKLANNRFLMHGCRNYHHLISFEKDGKYWLGVPGIYHPQEERAARAFGFVEFMMPEEGEVELMEDEQSQQEEFGYWCRTVNNLIKG